MYLPGSVLVFTIKVLETLSFLSRKEAGGTNGAAPSLVSDVSEYNSCRWKFGSVWEKWLQLSFFVCSSRKYFHISAPQDMFGTFLWTRRMFPVKSWISERPVIKMKTRPKSLLQHAMFYSPNILVYVAFSGEASESSGSLVYCLLDVIDHVTYTRQDKCSSLCFIHNNTFTF